jgi:hypothetical protein
MAKISAPSKPEKKKSRKVTHIRIHKGGNGFEVHHELEPQRKPGASLGLGGYEPDPKPNFFTGGNAKQAMLDHVGQLSDQMGGDEPDAPGAQAAAGPVQAA